MQLAVGELEEQYPGRVLAKNVDATTPESKAKVAELGFKNHGMVISAADGSVLWTQPDHDVRMEDVRAAIERLRPGA